MAKQLTDDNVDSILSRVVTYLETHPAMFEPLTGAMTDEGYDHFAEFFRTQLDPYSNGYRNHN